MSFLTRTSKSFTIFLGHRGVVYFTLDIINVSLLANKVLGIRFSSPDLPSGCLFLMLPAHLELNIFKGEYIIVCRVKYARVFLQISTFSVVIHFWVLSQYLG